MPRIQKILLISSAAGLLVIAAVLCFTYAGHRLAQEETATVALADTSGSIVTVSPYQAPLEQMVHGFGAQYSDTTGLYVIDVANNAAASYNGSRQFVSASLYKLFVAYLVFDAIDAQTLSPDAMTQTADTTVERCLDLMITISDNTCGAALGGLIGWQNIDDRLQREGYTNTSLNNYDAYGTLIADKLTTPEDVSLLLRRLQSGDLLSPAATEQFMTLLQEQTLNYALPTGLDSTISFAHKTGILDSVSHDAGFITYQGRVYIVVMMTDGWTHAYTESISEFTAFGQAVSAYVTLYAP